MIYIVRGSDFTNLLGFFIRIMEMMILLIGLCRHDIGERAGRAALHAEGLGIDALRGFVCMQDGAELSEILDSDEDMTMGGM